jgi:hypothetical protein
VNTSDAYRYAWENARRNPDGSVVEGDLTVLVAAIVDFDVEKEKLGFAQRIIARRKRPGQTAPEGAVVFPGMELYAYEPDRLLADDRGNVIENRSAVVRFKVAESRRAQGDAEKALGRATREQNEMGHFAVWSSEELAKGRDPREVTWDNCVRETGLWKDSEPDTDSGKGEPDDEARS